MPKPNWNPIRKGRIYCSPACGNNCTYAQYNKVKKQAAALCTVLGPAWKPIVEENLHWFSYAQARPSHNVLINIWPGVSPTDSFWADIHISIPQLGTTRQFCAYGISPLQALQKAFQQAFTLGTALVKACKKMEDVLKVTPKCLKDDII